MMRLSCVFCAVALSTILPISPVRFDQSLLHVQKRNHASAGGSSGSANEKGGGSGCPTLNFLYEPLYVKVLGVPPQPSPSIRSTFKSKLVTEQE